MSYSPDEIPPIQRSYVYSVMGHACSIGLPLSRTLELGAMTALDHRIRDVLLSAKAEVEMGGSISETMRKSGFFTREELERIDEGESRGELGVQFQRLAADLNHNLRSVY